MKQRMLTTLISKVGRKYILGSINRDDRPVRSTFSAQGIKCLLGLGFRVGIQIPSNTI